ncbi:MAG: mechanosensitive ion channel family protein [Acidobacteriota bacterium]|nr:mechanosensitive ion channel family protein [Acidobacteriota bacterium]
MGSKHSQAANYLHYMQRLTHLSPQIVIFLSSAAVIIIAIAVGYGIKRLLRHWRLKAKKPSAALVLAVSEQLPIPLLLLGALYGIMKFTVLPGRVERSGSELIFALVVAIIFYFLSKGVVTFLIRLAQRKPELERVTQPSIFVVRLVFVVLALIIILESLGVNLLALWTTLGVGSVAIAFGLQETLSNIFAGLYIMADQPIGPGDYVKLDLGPEGYLVRTGWRATALRTLANNIVYIPNASLAKAVITNYSKPEDRMSLTIPVSVAYGTDPSTVERALLSVAGEAVNARLDGLLPYPEPTVRLIPGFGASTLDFSLGVQVRRFVDQYLVQSELRKRIIDRFAKDGIQMPFPTQTVLLDAAAKGAAEFLKSRDGN